MDTPTRQPNDQQRAYDRLIRRRMRAANLAAWSRAGGIQATWLVVLIAGAAVPLTEALITSGWTWVSPVLGFVIVIAAGVERIFSRTTPAAVALDLLRRDLARERRLLLTTRAEASADPDEAFRTYASHVEAHLAAYDHTMVTYNTSIVGVDPGSAPR